MPYPTGKLPARYDRKALHFEDFATPSKIKVPANVHADAPQRYDWGMLGNDSKSDCVQAGADHETIIVNALGGSEVSFTEDNALSDYSAITGYDPRDPSTDQGTYVDEALSYRRHTGMIDAEGKRHKIGAYLQLEPGNWDHVKMALFLGHIVGIGIKFPGSAMDQFDDHQPWRVVKGWEFEGGHYVPVFQVVQKRIECITWGQRQAMSLAFYEAVCDEAYCILSPEMLVKGKTQEGFDLGGVASAVAALSK